MVMKTVISPFPVSPLLFGQVAFYSPTFSRTYAFSLSWGFLRGISPNSKQPCIPSYLWSSTFFYIEKLLPFNHLASWLCFVCGGVFFLFSNLDFVWWGWIIFVQMVPIPGHFAEYLWTRNHREIFFFFFWFKKVPQFAPCCLFFL